MTREEAHNFLCKTDLQAKRKSGKKRKLRRKFNYKKKKKKNLDYKKLEKMKKEPSASTVYRTRQKVKELVPKEDKQDKKFIDLLVEIRNTIKIKALYLKTIYFYILFSSIYIHTFFVFLKFYYIILN